MLRVAKSQKEEEISVAPVLKLDIRFYKVSTKLTNCTWTDGFSCLMCIKLRNSRFMSKEGPYLQKHVFLKHHSLLPTPGHFSLLTRDGLSKTCLLVSSLEVGDL